MKILIVDDSRVMRRIIAGAVQVLGYESIEAQDGQIALDVLANNGDEIGAITMDIAMPNLNGIECLEKIKESEQLKDIPVIMVSAESEKSMLLKAVRLGAKHYVTKPFTPEDITTRLMEVVDMDDEF